MFTGAVSTNSNYQELQAYIQQRRSDAQQLGQALQSGDLAGAQQEYNAIQTLAQTGPFANGDAFSVSARQQDFDAIGQALQAGDLAGAQQAFAQLQSTFHPQQSLQPQGPPVEVIVNLGSSGAASTGSSSAVTQPTAQPVSPAPSTQAPSGPEIIVNLGNAPAGEQITIGLNNTGNGTEQVTLSVANQQNQNPEQITFNLSQNSNEQIVLNLFNSSTSSPAQGNVSVTA